MHQLIDKKNKIIILLLLLLILSTTSGKLTENRKSYLSTINQINIEGLSNTDNKKIFNELSNLLNKNILLIERQELQMILRKYNIIEEYSIKKVYPSIINIKIKPTEFIARLSNKKQLVGTNGKLIENKEYDKILPNLFGEFNSEEFLKLKKDISSSKFTFTKFKTLYFFPSNRWDILTNDGILIKLAQDNVSQSLNFAYKIINNNNFKNKKLIDLRVKNHLIIK